MPVSTTYNNMISQIVVDEFPPPASEGDSPKRHMSQPDRTCEAASIEDDDDTLVTFVGAAKARRENITVEMDATQDNLTGMEDRNGRNHGIG